MKRLMIAAIVLAACSSSAPALAGSKSVLDNDPDMFAVVTPDRLLGKTTRRQWLTLWPVPGKEYWAAWDCKDKACDSAQRAHERATAKLIPRIATDPKPEDAASVPQTGAK